MVLRECSSQVSVAVMSNSTLEVINYIEHYGLKRRFISPLGKYENVTIHHSWNAPHRISNYALFKLQRHSDHHENPLKPYHLLATYDEAPTLPQGYGICIVVALLPSIWYKVMNPLVELQAKNQKPSKEILDRANSLIFKCMIWLTIISFFFVCLAEYLK